MKNNRELEGLNSFTLEPPVEPPVKKRKIDHPLSCALKGNEAPFEENENIIYLYAREHNLNYGKIKNKITNMFYKRQFEKLEQYLIDVPNEIKDKVFQLKFYPLINFSFSMQSRLEMFQFILRHVSADVLKILFKQEEYSIFKNFLFMEKMTEAFKNDTEEERQYRIDKFIFVIKTIGIEAASQVIAVEAVSEKITEDFNKACQEYNSEMQHNSPTNCL